MKDETSRIINESRCSQEYRNRLLRRRYDDVLDFEPFSDGFKITRDAQTAKPQSFRTGDEWFGYGPLGTYLVSSLYQLKGV